jgi:hypothetical protein
LRRAGSGGASFRGKNQATGTNRQATAGDDPGRVLRVITVGKAVLGDFLTPGPGVAATEIAKVVDESGIGRPLAGRRIDESVEVLQEGLKGWRSVGKS